MSTALLSLEGVHTHIGAYHILHGVDMQVPRGQLTLLLGRNGAGKTTTLRSTMGLWRASQGRVVFAGQDITRWSPHRIVAAGICQVPEGRQVFAPLSVEDNLKLGAYLQRRDAAWVRQTMDHVYALFPILAERRQQLAGSLSGGQQQMLAIGRALLGRPRLLLLDEPSMGLAPLLVEEIFRVIVELNAQGVAILLVEQNARAALAIARRGYILETGRIIKTAPAADLLADDAVRRAYLGY